MPQLEPAFSPRMTSTPVPPLPPAIAWRQTPLGQYVLAWEQEKLDMALADVFGYNALQLGMPEQDFLRANRIALRQTIALPTDARNNVRSPHLLAEFSQLPIASQSVDLLLLPHVLEFHPEPHQILREAHRILRPEGRLFILGFNPLSLWGLTRSLPGRVRGQPKNGQYLSVLRLRDWLKLLNFEVDRGAFGIYVPPCKSETWLRRWHFMELAGDRWWGFTGSVYMLRAIKRVAGMRLILPAWDTGKKLAAKAFTPATNRTHKEPHEESSYDK
ncbi:methyltransferase type 11 [Betaproteobacteria bacterium]|nr:methyltransferase type 11 [Betaproteobacteria bacterium]